MQNMVFLKITVAPTIQGGLSPKAILQNMCNMNSVTNA